MTRLEVALLFAALWEAGVIVALAWRIRQFKRQAPLRVEWDMSPLLAGRGGGKVSTAETLRRQAAEALGVCLHDDGTVSEVVGVPHGPHLGPGVEVEVSRGVDGSDRRRYRVVGTETGAYLERVDPPSGRPLHPFAPDGG